MAQTIRRDVTYTLPKKGYSRTYPVEFQDNAFTRKAGSILIMANTYAEIKIVSYLDGDLLLLDVTKFDYCGRQTDFFQALMKRGDFGRMIDPD